MPRLNAKQFHREALRRQIQFTRYTTGQVNSVKSCVDELYNTIARRAVKIKYIETKKQFADFKTFVREQCLAYRHKVYDQMQKELVGMVKEQSRWIYSNSPKRLKKCDNDKILRNINFEAFSDTENIASFVKRLFNQVFQTWTAQASIAYRTRQPLKDMAENIMGTNGAN
jgi:hypothetical protein